MDEILKTLVNSELLSEDAKNEISVKLQEAFDAKVKEGIKTASKVHKAKLKEQFDAELAEMTAKLDDFLKENMKGALAKSIRKEFKEEFEVERQRILEGLSAFLETNMKRLKPVKESKQDLAAKAFYTMVKEAFLDEQEIDNKAKAIISKLKESLQESKEENSRLYQKIVESKKKDESRIIEGKVEETLKLIPKDKRGIAKKLLEGVTLKDFDVTASTIIDELVESEVVDLKTKKQHTEQVVESVKKEEASFDERAYLRQLAGK